MAYNRDMERTHRPEDVSALHDLWCGPSMHDLATNWRETPADERTAFLASVREQAAAEGVAVPDSAIVQALNDLVAQGWAIA